MKRSDFDRLARARGWILWSVTPGEGSTYVCEHTGCRNAVMVSDDRIARGKAPAPCRRPHTKRFATRLVQSHMDLMTHLRQRRLRLGLSQEDVEAAAGLTADHLGKIETLARLPQFPTYFAIAETLGFDIALIPKALPDQTMAIIDHKAGKPVPERHPPTGWQGGQGSSGEQALSVIEGIR